MTAEFLVQAIVPVTVIIMMTTVGLNLRLDAVRENFRRPRSLLICTLLQIVLLPIVVLILIAVLAPPPLIAIVMFVIAISPGGTLSNMYTHLAGGNLALSVMMTIITTLLVSMTAHVVAGVAVATGMLSFDGAGQLSPVAIASDLLRVSLLPICLGVLCAWRLPVLSARIRPAFNALCVVSLVTAVVCSAVVSWPVAQQAAVATLGYAAALVFVSLLLGTVVSAALPPDDRSACVIEFGVRNLPIALLLSSSVSASPEVVAFLLFCLIVSASVLLTFTVLRRSFVRRRVAWGVRHREAVLTKGIERTR